MAKYVLFHFFLTNKEGLVRDVNVGGSLGCSDHSMMEFKILCERSMAINTIATLDFQRAKFDLYKTLLGDFPWARALEGKGAHEN